MWSQVESLLEDVMSALNEVSSEIDSQESHTEALNGLVETLFHERAGEAPLIYFSVAKRDSYSHLVCWQRRK